MNRRIGPVQAGQVRQKSILRSVAGGRDESNEPQRFTFTTPDGGAGLPWGAGSRLGRVTRERATLKAISKDFGNP